MFLVNLSTWKTTTTLNITKYNVLNHSPKRKPHILLSVSMIYLPKDRVISVHDLTVDLRQFCEFLKKFVSKYLVIRYLILNDWVKYNIGVDEWWVYHECWTFYKFIKYTVGVGLKFT